MKQIFLQAMIILTFGSAKAQSADYFIKNGDLMIKKDHSTSTFQEGDNNPILDFAEGKLNQRKYLIYWRADGEAKICTLREDGTWSTQVNFNCSCDKQISKIKFLDSQNLIITCTNGDRYKKTIYPNGGGSESSY
jgi:hypothetical protein